MKHSCLPQQPASASQDAALTFILCFSCLPLDLGVLSFIHQMMRALSPSLIPSSIMNQTIKTYLAAIPYMQIILGLPEPRAFSSLPHLWLVQTGIQCTHLQRVSFPPRVRLPVTSAILTRIKAHWSGKASDPDITMLWAAACLCFFGFSSIRRDHCSQRSEL